MKVNVKKFVFALIIGVLVAGSASAEVIAVVNGEKITREDIEKSLAEIAEMEDGGKPTLETFPPDFQINFIEKYIEKRLLIGEARRQNAHKVQSVVEKVRAAEDYLAQQEYLTSLVVRARTEEKLKEIYDDRFSKKKGKVEVHASHILVKTEEEAKALKKKLDEGADFAELAKENSIEPGSKASEGDLGYFVYEQMVPEFSKAAFALKKNEISAPVKSDFGWHIIKKHDQRKVVLPDFKKIIPDLEAELARRVINEKVIELKKNAKIELEPKFGGEEKKEEKPKNIGEKMGEKLKVLLGKEKEEVEPKAEEKSEKEAEEKKEEVNKEKTKIDIQIKDMEEEEKDGGSEQN